jgi:hypothetical protein
MKKYNHFRKQEARYLTTLKVAMIYAIIAALIYLIQNFGEVWTNIKTLLNS